MIKGNSTLQAEGGYYFYVKNSV